MALDPSINLIPQEEKHEQAKTEAVKQSTIFVVILMILVGGASAYLFYITNNLKKESAQLDKSISDYRLQVQSMSPIEITARNLSSRYATLQEISSQNVVYSKLLQEIKNRTPGAIVIKDLTIAGNGKLTVSGDGADYISIASFISKLLENKTLFTDVVLNSVNLNSTEDRADFFIGITFNPEALR